MSRPMQPDTKSSHLLSGVLAGPQLLSPQLGAFLWDHWLAGENIKITVNNQEEKSVNRFTFLNLCTNQSNHAQKDPCTSVPLARNSGKAGLETPFDGEFEVRKKVLGLRFWVSQDQSWGWKQHLLYPSLDSTYHPGARGP